MFRLFQKACMTPHEAFIDGRLSEAVELQRVVVRDRPEDDAARLYLVELLTLAGCLHEARDQLRDIASEDPDWPAWRSFFMRLLKAERRRSVKSQRPIVLPGPAPDHAVWRWRAIRALQAEDASKALRCVDRAYAATPEVHGFVDGREFTGLGDVDERFESVLEAFADGRYFWFPWEAVRRIKLAPEKHPRDRWAREAELLLQDGSSAQVHLPLIYSGSSDADGAFAVGLETDYICPDDGPVRCIGGKTLVFGDQEVRLGDCRMIEIRG